MERLSVSSYTGVTNLLKNSPYFGPIPYTMPINICLIYQHSTLHCIDFTTVIIVYSPTLCSVFFSGTNGCNIFFLLWTEINLFSVLYDAVEHTTVTTVFCFFLFTVLFYVHCFHNSLIVLEPHLSPFLLFPFFHWLYLFSSFVHPFPYCQNSPTPFPGRLACIFCVLLVLSVFLS